MNWQLKIWPPGREKLGNTTHVACFLVMIPDKALATDWSREISFAFTARPDHPVGDEDSAVVGVLDAGGQEAEPGALPPDRKLLESTKSDKHAFTALGDRDWGFWKCFDATQFLPSIGAM